MGVAMDAQMLIDHLVRARTAVRPPGRPLVSYKTLLEECNAMQCTNEEITLECPSAAPLYLASLISLRYFDHCTFSCLPTLDG